MDSGQIDFYQHNTVCSNTCRSTKFDVLFSNARIPPGAAVQPSPSCLVLDPLGRQMPPLTGRFSLSCCFFIIQKLLWYTVIYSHIYQIQQLPKKVQRIMIKEVHVLKCSLAAVVFLGEVTSDAVEVQTPLEEKFSSAAEWGAGPAANPATTNGHAKRNRADVPGKQKAERKTQRWTGRQETSVHLLILPSSMSCVSCSL